LRPPARERAVIHVLTVHFQSDCWIDVQLEHLERYLDRPHRVVADLEGIGAEWEQRFDVVTHLSEDAGRHLRHPDKLNRLAELVAREAPDDDVLMFLDGDAFPIAPLGAFVEAQLARFPLAAIRRDESLGDVQPHPSFCVTTVGFWRQIGGDWSHGAEWAWTDSLGRQVDDVGGKLLALLSDSGIEWGPLLRTNRRGLHPVLFGVYEDVVYHHGAGFRSVVERADRADPGRVVLMPSWLPPEPPASWAGGLAWRMRAKLWYLRSKRPLVKEEERIARRNQQLSERVLAMIRTDPDFWRKV